MIIAFILLICFFHLFFFICIYIDILLLAFYTFCLFVLTLSSLFFLSILLCKLYDMNKVIIITIKNVNVSFEVIYNFLSWNMWMSQKQKVINSWTRVWNQVCVLLQTKPSLIIFDYLLEFYISGVMMDFTEDVCCCWLSSGTQVTPETERVTWYGTMLSWAVPQRLASRPAFR